jgi:hypothetical protein
MTRKEAEALVQALVTLREGADDAVASLSVGAYPTLKADGTLIKAGTRINWHGQIKRAAVDLWDMAENNPDNAPALWEDISYRDGYRIIPETITTGTAFMKDEFGWWGDVLYVSLLDNNVWTPEEYPTGWELYYAK